MYKKIEYVNMSNIFYQKEIHIMKISVKTLVCLCTVALGAVQAKAVTFHGVEVLDDSLTAKHLIPAIQDSTEQLLGDLIPQARKRQEQVKAIIQEHFGDQDPHQERSDLLMAASPEERESEAFLRKTTHLLQHEQQKAFWQR